MSNFIRFNYLYRDSGNYKKFGSKLFTNPDHLTNDVIEYNIQLHLISHEFFYPDCLGIKKFKSHRHENDYSWYEFESIEMLEKIDNPKMKMESINSFLSKLEGMRNFDIYIKGDQP
jgi:hypothetical protein